ncbi:hypothetical protein EV121DRAFT_216286 [Schizophyllum commune]
MSFLQSAPIDGESVWARARADELGYTAGDDGVTSQQIDELINKAAEDFEEPELPDQLRAHAEFLMRAYIKEKTRTAHVRIAKAFIAFQVARDPSFKPGVVDDQTPRRINEFITKGLPTRSRAVAEFMVGLEKTKAAAGEVSQSARALTLDDMHRLFDLCIVQPHKSEKQDALASQRKGIVRYTAYLLAWLLVLRIDEAMSLTFESIDKIPRERKSFKNTYSAISNIYHCRTLLRRTPRPSKDTAERYWTQLAPSC